MNKEAEVHVCMLINKVIRKIEQILTKHLIRGGSGLLFWVGQLILGGLGRVGGGLEGIFTQSGSLK